MLRTADRLRERMSLLCAWRVPDLVITGSHCLGLDLVAGALIRADLSLRIIAVGSMGGLQALSRGECDLAPVHLLDPASDTFNSPFLSEGQTLIPGWRRMQGIAFRRDDSRFAGLDAETAIAAAIADPDCLMVNRNQGAGTRILIDKLLGGRRPSGYWNQPRSHTAVAAATLSDSPDCIGMITVWLAACSNCADTPAPSLPISHAHGWLKSV